MSFSEAQVTQNNVEEGSGQSQTQPNLRQLEIEAYSAIVSALFAQGELSWRKDQLLQEVRWALKISDDLHKREILRVHSDSSLNKIQQKLANSIVPSELLYNNFENKTDKNKAPPRKKRKVANSPSRGSNIDYDQYEEKSTKRAAPRKTATGARTPNVPKDESKMKKLKSEDVPVLDNESEEELKAKKARMEQEKAEILQKLASLTSIEDSDDEEMTVDQPVDQTQFTFSTTEKIQDI